MKTETAESLCYSVNLENGDGSTSGCSAEAEMEGTDRSFFFRGLSASVDLMLQTSKREPVLTEAEMQG